MCSGSEGVKTKSSPDDKDNNNHDNDDEYSLISEGRSIRKGLRPELIYRFPSETMCEDENSQKYEAGYDKDSNHNVRVEVEERWQGK